MSVWTATAGGPKLQLKSVKASRRMEEQRTVKPTFLPKG